MSVLSLYKRVKKKKMMKRNQRYMDLSSDSIYGDSFGIEVRHPENRVYLTVAPDSYVDGKFIFETSSGKINIGKECHIGASTFISIDEINIGNNVTIAWNRLFYDHNSHSVLYEERKNDTKQEISDMKLYGDPIKNKNWEVVKHAPIKICDKAWIGVDCKILKGVTVGEGAVVGAGSVVVKDVRPWTLVGGNPAREIKEIEH